MKKLLTLALVLASANAFASRAGNTALGNSVHIADAYSPEVIAASSEYFSIETGKTAVTQAAGQNALNAEGHLVKSVGPGFLSLGIGHLDSTIFATRSVAAAGVTTMKPQQNPLEISYGMKMDNMNVGAGLIYSNYETKEGTLKDKESSMGLKLGVSTDLFYGRLKVIFADNYKDSTTAGSEVEYKGKTAFVVSGGMNFGSTSVHAQISQTGGKITSAGTDVANGDKTEISLKAVETIKNDGNDFFYGAGLTTSSSKETVGDTKETTLNLPLIIGLEASATSWLKLRASVTQDVLLSNTKKDDATTPANNVETNPGLNTTHFAAGAGIAYNKIVIDATLANDTTTDTSKQKINLDNLLGTVGVSYKF